MTAPRRISVLMTTEGTYPHSSGGVSTWCDSLIRNTPEVHYTLVPIMMNPHIELKYDPPPNARRVINVPLWGIEEPAEFLDIAFASLHLRKRRLGMHSSIYARKFRGHIGDSVGPANALLLQFHRNVVFPDLLYRKELAAREHCIRNVTEMRAK